MCVVTVADPRLRLFWFLLVVTLAAQTVSYASYCFSHA